jgi:PEP-CTERM motif
MNCRVCLTALSIAAAFGGPASAALEIDPTFDSSITSLANAAQVESSITTAISALESLYTNSGDVPVLFEYDAGLGGGAETDSALANTTYSSYVSTLTADSAAHPSNTTLALAVSHLPSAGTLAADYGSTPGMTVTAPFANIILGSAQFLCFTSTGAFNGSCGQTYEAVVTVSAPGGDTTGFYNPSGPGLNSTAVSAVEHELDEVLGGGGGGTTLIDTSSGNPSHLGPLDLYRYSSTGSGCTVATGLTHTLSWTDSSGAVTCLSIDGGNTAIAQFNQAGGGSDYGDFAEPNPAIQDAFEPSSDSPIYSVLSPEYAMMESIGYDSVPEPAIFGLFAASVLGLGWLRRRRTKAGWDGNE